MTQTCCLCDTSKLDAHTHTRIHPYNVPQVVSVGEHAVDHNPAFKLYLVTRNTAPALTPDVVPLLTVTNFSITRSGLESE